MKKIVSIAAAAVLAVGLAGCAAEPEGEVLPITPDVVDGDTNGSDSDVNINGGAGAGSEENDGTVNITGELDPFQPTKMLEQAQASIDLAIEQGYVETINFGSDELPSIVMYDPSRPLETAGILVLDSDVAIGIEATSVEELLGGLVEVKAQAQAMINLIDMGGDTASQYVNIITNDGFTFTMVGGDSAMRVKTNDNGLIQSVIVETPEGDVTYEFRYELTPADKELFTIADEFGDF